MGKINDYVKCQKFIVSNELKFKEAQMGLNVAQSDFLEQALLCIFDSMERIADEIDEMKHKKDDA